MGRLLPVVTVRDFPTAQAGMLTRTAEFDQVRTFTKIVFGPPMIHMEEMRQLLCRTYSGLRDRVVMAVDDWIGDGGEFIAHAWLSELCTLVQERFADGDYEQSVQLFELVELLLDQGDDSVKAAISTGFIEGLQHQQRIDPVLWQSLLGCSARAHCRAMDAFYGVET